MYKNSFRRDWNHLQGLPQEKRAKGTTAEFFFARNKTGTIDKFGKKINFQFSNGKFIFGL